MTTTPVTVDHDGPPARREEPLGRVLGLGGQDDSLVFAVALAAALAVHAVAGVRAARVFPYLAELAETVRQGMKERLRSQVDIDLTPPPPPKEEPPPEPEKEPEPPPQAQKLAPTPQAPPAAAEAGKVLTAEADPNEPVDLTDEGFVTGTSDRFAGGVTAAAGTGKNAVRSAAAVPTGVGTGTPKATVVAAPKVDLSRAPKPLGSNDWDCPYPAEADAEGINFMKVQIAVTVTTDGRARSVTVLKDPGFGFGKAARSCALRKPYSVALDSDGKPIEQTCTISVKFSR